MIALAGATMKDDRPPLQEMRMSDRDWLGEARQQPCEADRRLFLSKYLEEIVTQVIQRCRDEHAAQCAQLRDALARQQEETKRLEVYRSRNVQLALELSQILGVTPDEDGSSFRDVIRNRMEALARVTAERDHERHEKETVADAAQAHARWSRERYATLLDAIRQLEQGGYFQHLDVCWPECTCGLTDRLSALRSGQQQTTGVDTAGRVSTGER